MPINKDRDIQVTAVISKELYVQLQKIADQQERTINKQIAYIERVCVKPWQKEIVNNNLPSSL